MPGSTADFIATNLEEIPLNPTWGLRAFEWRRPNPVDPARCPSPVERL
jgi:hypothetical protein